MDRENVKRGILLSLVDRILKELEQDPERTVRKLVDLGGQFAQGRFRSYFFDLVQTMLDDENSAYYDLVRRAAFEVDREALKTFGVAVGYDSFTLGARTIRAREAVCGYQIPWALLLRLDGGENSLGRTDYDRILAEGIADGIRAYLFYVDDGKADLELVLDLAEAHPECAFVLALPPRRVDQELVSRLCEARNLMAALDSEGEGFAEAALLLRKARRFYACHRLYRGGEDVADIESGAWAARAAEAGCAFAFAHPDSGCTDEQCDRVSRYTKTVRMQQSEPVILSDAYADYLFIDRVISGEPVFVGVLPDGTVTRCDGRREVTTAENLRETSLDRVLEHLSGQSAGN